MELEVENLVIDAPIRTDRSVCIGAGPSLVIRATGRVEINEYIYLVGGEPTLVEPAGTDGGSLQIEAEEIVVDAVLFVAGSDGAYHFVGAETALADGGNGGQITLTASDSLVVTERARFELDGGQGAVCGSEGTLSWSAPDIDVEEIFTTGVGNNFVANAQSLPCVGLELVGAVYVDEAPSARVFAGGIRIDPAGDWVEDLFELRLTPPLFLELDLTSSTTEANLDLHLLQLDSSMTWSSNGLSSTESLRVTLTEDRYFIGVSAADDMTDPLLVADYLLRMDCRPL